MKRIQDIIGLPLIGIDEAAELGEVKEILINPGEGKVKYLVIKDYQWYYGAKVILFEEVVSIGEDAITIQDEKVLQKFSEVEEAVILEKKNIAVLNAKVYTQGGEYIGVIKDYYIDKSKGIILKCILYNPKDSEKFYEMENPKIVSFGPRTLVIEGDMDEGNSKTQGISLSVRNNHPAEKEKGEDITSINLEKEISNEKAFEEKQRQFLIGRQAIHRIMDEKGDLLLEEGQILTEDILRRVQDKNKIVELTINTK